MTALRERFGAITSLASQRAIRKGAWGIGDQALMSITNFATMVLVARNLSAGEFGLYSLAYTGLLFSNSLQIALIVQPHTSLGAPKTGPDYIRYTTDTAWIQGIFALLTSLVMLAVALVALGLGWWTGMMLLTLAPATAAWQLQNFVRRVLYTKGEVRPAFTNDLVSYGGQLAMVFLLATTGSLTPTSAMAALGATSAAGFVFGVWQIRSHLEWRLDRGRIRRTLAVNWAFGKWLLGGNIAYWTSAQAYPVLAAGLVSVAATGAMRAAQTIIGPTNVLTMALDPLFGPKTATVYAREGLPALRTMLSKMQLFVFLTIGVYCLTVAIFAEPILRVLYGAEYGQYSWLLVVVALKNLVDSLRDPAKVCFKAIGETSVLFRTNVAASVVNLTIGVAAVHAFGFPGVAIGLILNSVTKIVMISHYQARLIGSIPPVISLLLPNRSLRSHEPERHHA